MILLLFTVFCIWPFLPALLNAGGSGSLSTWDYFEPREVGAKSVFKWSQLPKPNNCQGDRQSPIDITEYKIDRSLRLISLLFTQGTTSQFNDVSLIFNKQTVKANLPQKGKAFISFDMGELNSWSLAQIHWHWGKNSSVGSEHRIGGNTYPLEQHLVAYNSRLYKSFVDAASKPDGLAVLGVFYQVGAANSELEKVVNSLVGANFDFSQSGKVKTQLDLKALHPVDLSKYYRYQGSLTTPPCTQNVMWSVLKSPLTVSEGQLNELRKASQGLDIFRPPQKVSLQTVVLYSSATILRAGTSSLLVLFWVLLFSLVAF